MYAMTTFVDSLVKTKVVGWGRECELKSTANKKVRFNDKKTPSYYWNLTQKYLEIQTNVSELRVNSVRYIGCCFTVSEVSRCEQGNENYERISWQSLLLQNCRQCWFVSPGMRIRIQKPWNLQNELLYQRLSTIYIFFKFLINGTQFLLNVMQRSKYQC